MTKLQCLECGKIIESRHTHDYNTCGCPNDAMIDGGNDYLRCGANDIKKIKILQDIIKCWNCNKPVQYCDCGRFNVTWVRDGPLRDRAIISLNKSFIKKE